MVNIQEHYQQLVGLTRLHLSQEYSEGHWLHSDAQTCDYFRERLSPSAPPKAAQAKAPSPKPVSAAAPQPRPVATLPKTAPPEVKTVLEKQPQTPTLVPPGAASHDDMNDLRKVLGDVVPRLTLLEIDSTIFQDRATTSTVKALVVVSADIPLPHQLLLKDLALALTLHDIPAQLVPALPSSEDRRLFPLPSIEGLIANPEGKRELWDKMQTLKQDEFQYVMSVI